MIIEADSIELTYGLKKVLNSVYLRVETGKITGLLGRNGSGKSSLFNVLFGNKKAQNQHIKVNQKVCTKPLYISKRIAYLPQTQLLPKHISIKNAFKLYEVSLELFTKDFPDLKIEHNNSVSRLSGGERRIIEIYLILKSNTDFIILDEPFNHLSPLYVEKFELLFNEEKQHKAILISDHIFRPILRLSDTLYFLDKGNMKLINSENELKDLQYFY